MKHIRVFVSLAFFLTGCFEQYQKVEPLIEIIASSETLPAPSVTPLSTKLPPTSTPETIATDAPTETSEPTATAIPIEIVLSEEDFNNLTDEEKQKLWNNAPNELDGLTKSNFSTVLPYLILYRDANGDSQIALNLLTKEKSTLLEAGIAEFDLESKYNFDYDGKKGELRLFVPEIPQSASPEVAEEEEIKTLDKMFEFVVSNGVKWGDFTNEMAGNKPVGYEIPHINIAWYIPNQIPKIGFGVPRTAGIDDQSRFDTFSNSIEYSGENCIILYYKSPESEYGILDKSVMIMIPVNRFLDMMLQEKVTIPPKP